MIKLPTTKEDKGLIAKDFRVMVLPAYIFVIVLFVVVAYLILPFNSFLRLREDL